MLNLKKIYHELGPTDRRILILSLLLMLFFGYMLYDDRLLTFNSLSTNPIIGEITETSSDVRHKQSNQLVWEAADTRSPIHIGDSLFTGPNSSASINIQNNNLQLQENSLVSFRKVKGLNVSNLNFGDFMVNVNGGLKLAVNGQLVELRGRNSKIKLSLDANQKLTWEAVRGETKIIAANGEVSKVNALNPLDSQAVASIFPPAARKDLTAPTYFWHIEEFYTTHKDRFRLRKEMPLWFNIPMTLHWKDADTKAIYTVQMAGDREFAHDLQMVDSTEKHHTFNRLKRGENHWRVSRNGGGWSSTEVVTFRPTLRDAAPQLTSGTPTLQLLSNSVEHILTWNPSPQATMYFIEASRSPSFPPEKTSIAQTDQLSHTIRFRSSGMFYFRVRAADGQNQLSTAGSTAVTVLEIPRLAAPTVPNGDMAFKNAKVVLPWRSPRGAVSFDVEVTDLRTQKVTRSRTTQPKLAFKKLANGPYTYQVTARDKYGRKSPPSLVKLFSVDVGYDANVMEVADSLPSERDPAQSLTMTNEVSQSEYMNEKYPGSKFQVEGAGFTMYSSRQVQQQDGAPLAATLGIRILKWFDRLGFEGFLKSKIFAYNSEGSKVAPMGAEIRGHRRWNVPFHWGDIFREIQISLFLAGEQYANSGTDQFAKKYSLMKVGTLIAFPIWRRWDTGGEIAYGRGFDSSYKFEIAGYLNYYIKKQWTYGVGYRVHLFNAGSLDSAPVLPYREGYLELYSALRYLY